MNKQLNQIQEVKEIIQNIILNRMRQYANTPLNERRNAYDELYELSREIDRTFPTYV